MTIPLSSFTSLFEVSIAVHLLYSLIPQIQQAFLAPAHLQYRHLQRSIVSFQRREEKIKRDQHDMEVDVKWEEMKPEEREEIKNHRIFFNDQLKEFRTLFTVLDWHNSGYETSILILDSIAIGKSRTFIPLSLLTASFSLLLIIISGFFPEWECHWFFLLTLVFIVIVPMPTMLFMTYCRSKKEIGEIVKAIQGMSRVIQDFSIGGIRKVTDYM